ncbi:hypothetical protein [Paenibacillus cellulositrophicus]|uniref:hypothetical protein n=1 Tax=Paenibacillus cellulositrophicus TaxID=562959 RepID=UPI003D951BE0
MMVELREEGQLKYSNQPSQTAKALNWGLVGLMGALVLGFMGYGVFWLIKGDWVVGSFITVVGLFLTGMLWLIFRIVRMPQKVLLRYELREEGYYTYVKQIKTGEESEHLVPFTQMQEVLIGRTTRYQPKGEGSIGFYVIGANIVMKWVDGEGHIQYSVFGLENPNELEAWVTEFRKHGIPVYGTEANVKFVRAENYQTAYAELPKAEYEPGANPLQIGSRERRDIPAWISPDMKARMEAEEKRRDKRLFRPVFLGVAAINLILAAAWMPSWPISDGAFADNSASTAVTLVNVVLLVLTGAYWRKRVRWYRSLLESVVVIAAQFAGAGIAALIGNAPAGLLDSIVVEGLLLVGISVVLFVIFRLVRWIVK